MDRRAFFCCMMTLGMTFSGQVVRFDQDAYWGAGLGSGVLSIASRVRYCGQWAQAAVR